MRTFASTDAGLRKLPIPERPLQLDYFDAAQPGLGLRVSYGGKRTFFVMYSASGKRCRLTLGELGYLEDGRLSMAIARKRARAKLGEIATGKNPAAEIREARRAPTMEMLVTDFLTTQHRKGVKSADKQRRMLARDVLPALGHLKARDVTRADIKRILRAVADRGAPIESKRLHEVLRKLFNYGHDEAEYGIDANPCLRLASMRAAARANGTARCPAHEDRNPSLSISDGSEGVLVHCHTSCSQGEVIDAAVDGALAGEAS